MILNTATIDRLPRTAKARMQPANKWIEALPEENVVDVARRSLRGRLESVEQFLQLAANKADRDVEYVHQLRVWTRRSLAALNIYAEVLPARRLKQLQKKLKRIRRAAGDARDDDVLLARLSAWRADDCGVELVERIEQHRREQQAPIIEVHKKYQSQHRFRQKYRNALRRIELRGRFSDCDHYPFERWAPMSLQPPVDAFFESAQASGDDLAAMHRFRITSKHLRYGMELMAGAFPTWFRKHLYVEVEQVQEYLGDVNDHAVAIDRFRMWKEEAGDDGVRHFLCDSIRQEEALLSRALANFRDYWTSERREQLRDAFRQAFESISLL